MANSEIIVEFVDHRQIYSGFFYRLPPIRKIFPRCFRIEFYLYLVPGSLLGGYLLF